ncbi:cobalamin B12-binding domain-containing protein [Pelagicoccus mobilis]|uniref:Corrinoid protein n=1 Tax=Pelagicoccus mobilis TaxID=415221 RepID=A0A934RY00_9BACT|nr:corrinoid protein [Pelagicoccus mobilis]MBK1875613.1 corrinoid protein [Pelagicoccus mobilis]
MNETLEKLVAAIKTGKRKDAKSATATALENGTEPQLILDALTEGMNDVGVRFRANEIFVPEVLVAARAMQKSMDLLEPVLVASGIEPEFSVVIGTVQGDLHDIGKNLVGMMLKGANFKVIDLGTDVSADAFSAAIKEHNPNVIALSALLTTTMPSMEEIVDCINAMDTDVKVMVGGAPVTQEFADKIGAHGFSTDAASAVELAKKLCA